MAGKQKNGKHPVAETKTYTGKLDISRGGMGFVTVAGMERDIIIKPENMLFALPGDEVQVAVRAQRDSSKRMEGSITSIIRRKQSEFSGHIEVHAHFAFLIPDSDKIPVDIYVPLHLLNGATNGDHVMVRIIEWSAKTKNPVGEVLSILTQETENEIAMRGILAENGFPLAFSDELLEEAARIPDGLDSAEMANRRDMRDTLTITIDPVDARDFDDAISVRTLKGGWYEVGVHIADVSHYVTPGSELDKEAYLRATSVYLPDRVLPMLPERLSNELCSLRPNEDKYTFSAIFTINKAGKVKETWLGKTAIHSNRRFTYEEVQEIVEGANGDYQKELLLLNTMAQNLRAERFKKGAINFSSQEVRFKLDEQARPVSIVIKESKEAHQLVEEFMLLANRAVATHVGHVLYKEKEVPFPYRVHDTPDEEKLSVFALFASRYGIRFNLSSPTTIAESFNLMLDSVKGKPEQHVLEQLGIRTMAKAEYTTHNVGHYGLGFDFYCHFTSPIRRYPDVLVHRILQQCLQNDIQPIKNLEVLCRHCSDQERRAMEAERAANKYKQVEYMKAFVGNEFEAVISGVASFGFWAETTEHKCEGLVAASELMDIDQFVWNEREYSLAGRYTGMRFAMGDKVTIKVLAANLAKRQLDYGLVGLPPKQKRKQAPAKQQQKGKQTKKNNNKKRK